MKKINFLVCFLLASAGFLMNVSLAQAAAVNAASKTNVTPGTQFTTFKGVPVFRLNIANSGDVPDTITTLSPTPSGTANDTAITLHFFKDVNNNGIADQGDIDLGASAAFATNDTKQTFDITDVEVPPAGGAVSVLITADGLALTNTNTFTLGFALATDIAMTVAPTGTFAMNNANALTVSNVAPAVTVANGATQPPGAARYIAAGTTNIVTKQVVISAAAGTSDSIVSLALTPSGTENDNTNVSSVVFYIDSGSEVGAIDGTDVQLVSTPATFSANNTKTAFTFSNPIQITQAEPSPTNILVVYNIGASAVNGGTLIQTIAAAGDVVAGSGTAVTDTVTASTVINIDNAPTVSSATAYTDRIIVNFSENVDGMWASSCSNYTVGGASITCGGMGTPFVDFQGNKVTIRGLSLSGSTILTITGNVINDTDGTPAALAAYNSGSLTVNALVLPTISSLSAISGAVGDSITITGTNFGTGTGGDANHKVFFSGGFSPTTGPLPSVEATSFTSWSNTSIVVTVPTGAKGGPVNVMSGGVMSDMNQNSFFDIAANYVAKVYYVYPGTLMPDGDKNNIRIVIGGMRGPEVHYVGDGTTTYSDANDEFTITGVSSMGWTWAYDITGAHLNSQGQQVDVAATQNHILTATSKKISGTITLGASCTDAGKNQNVVIFAMPDQVDTGNANFKSMDPAFFKTNTSCTVNYSVGVPINGIYRVEANIPPDSSSSTVSSASFTTPDALSVTVNDDTPSGKNFTFTSATHRIVGTVVKPAGGLGSTERGMLFVYAYQPREGGGGTGTQVADNGTFTLYVIPGTWKVGVGGPNMPFPVEVQVDVDNTYELADPAKGPTITIAPPADFIEGYVKDSAGNGLANSSIYAWLVGGPGGGNAQTDSQGYYKMYVTPGSSYTVGANSQSFGFLGEQSGIAVTSSTHPTVNFTVSSSNNYTISGTVTKNTVALQQAFVFITEGEFGPMLGSGGTDAAGAYTVKISGGANRWIHAGLPAKGEVYLENLGTISANNLSKDIAITSSTIKVRISPASSFTQAFVGVHSDTGGGFADTPVITAECTGSGASCREYQIDIKRPTSGTTTYYVDGGIPGYGPLPQISVGVTSGGGFVETSGTSNDGIIEITLGGLWTISGTVTGANVTDAWVWASGPNGGGGSAVVAGSYSLQLRDGTYDIGVGKPGYIGNKISATVDGVNLDSQDLILTTATNTITGTVYLPDGVTTAINAQVWAENGSGGMSGGSTDASGNYSLSVSSGTWTVKAAYDGYNSTGILVTAPASGKNITLAVISGFTPNTKNSPITPSDGGIMSGTGFKIDFPKNALGTGTSAGTVEVKSTTNVVTKNDRQLIGTAKEFTVRNSSNQNVTTLSGSATIELTVSKAELVSSGLSFSQVKDIKITYYDSTGGSWVEIPTVVTLSVPTATTIAELDADPAITLTGTTTHLSTYSPSIPTDADAPPTPTGLIANTAGSGNAILSWTASAGAAKYDIYKKVGDDYPYLAQTTSTSYSASGLTDGTTYYFKVSALDSSNRESAATSAVSVIPVAGGQGSGALPSSSSSSTSSNTTSATSSTSSITTTTTTTTAVTTTPTTIPGCGNRVTGFSTATGQSCVGNTASATPATSATPAVPGVSSAIPATSATPALYNFGTKTLKNGSKGEPVKELQRFLNKVLKTNTKVDGKLGPKTVALIKKWQKENGLVADGLIGPKTKAKMNASAQ